MCVGVFFPCFFLFFSRQPSSLVLGRPLKEIRGGGGGGEGVGAPSELGYKSHVTLGALWLSTAKRRRREGRKGGRGRKGE